MPVGEWTEDEQYYIWTGDIKIAKQFDPTTKSAIILLGPEGGIAEIPALVKGDPGLPATLDSTVSLTTLAWNDPTTESASFTTLTPATGTTSPVYRLNLSVRQGAPGASGASAVLTASDVVGTATDGYYLAKTTVNSVDKATWVAPKVGGQYWPATTTNTSGTDGQNRTLVSVSIPAQPFDWRPRVFGQVVVSGTANTRVDLIARLNDAIAGDIVGRGFGLVGATPPPVNLVSGSPAGSASTVGRVAAGSAASVFLRAEQQASTTDSYSTAAASTWFMVEVAPIP